MVLRCSRCESEIPDGAGFCPGCGEEVPGSGRDLGRVPALICAYACLAILFGLYATVCWATTPWLWPELADADGTLDGYGYDEIRAMCLWMAAAAFLSGAFAMMSWLMLRSGRRENAAAACIVASLCPFASLAGGVTAEDAAVVVILCAVGLYMSYRIFASMPGRKSN